MLISFWRRQIYRFLLRHIHHALNILITFLVVLTVWDAAQGYRHQHRQPPCSPGRTDERVFIASIHWNNEAILRSHWIPSLLDLARHLGPENIFVSIQESGSWDGTKDTLRILDSQLEALDVRRTIVLDSTTHRDEINRPPTESGWIRTPRDRTELRRIPYLARIRNAVLEPLNKLAEEGEYFDRVLWINDVVFSVDDLFTLLNTRNGNYAAACALDFANPPHFYDTFALRDAEGHAAIMSTWPYFRARESRNAVKAGLPVPVTSCWNGVVSMSAQPFYNTTHPLQFRGIADSLANYHLEGSECCLIHIDNPESSEKGVWLNPKVRVGYSGAAYEAVHSESRSFGTVWWSLWENRLRRWFTTPWFEMSVVARRVASWRAGDGSSDEEGNVCLLNEMQVIVENGWAHV